MKPKPHEALGVTERATPDEIKAAYRRLAREHHPDNGGDPARMAAINHAYEALTDPDFAAKAERAEREETIIGQLLQFFDKALGRSDPVAASILIARETEQQLVANRHKLMREATRLRSIATQVKRKKPGDNLIATSLLDRAEKLDKAAVALLRDIDIVAEVTSRLAEYEFEPPHKRPETMLLSWARTEGETR